MKALYIDKPGLASIHSIDDARAAGDNVLLRVRMVGFCGSDLNSFRGKNPLVSFPRIPGHEVSATIVEGSRTNPALSAGVDVTLSPYTNCGKCASCRRGRPTPAGSTKLSASSVMARSPNSFACRRKKSTPRTLADGVVPRRAANCGFSCCRARPRDGPDTLAVFGCGGVGFGAIAASSFRRATTIAVDVADDKLRLARASWRRPYDQYTQRRPARAVAELT